MFISCWLELIVELPWNGLAKYYFLANSINLIYHYFCPGPTEIIVSGGMTMPQVIASLEPIPKKSQSIRLNRIMT
jgi:hypothetical protein